MKKAITPVISIIILLLITISLAGMGWTYMSGYYEAMTAKQIKVVEGSAYGNEVMIMNIGTADIEESDLRVLVDGKDAGILEMSASTIEPKKSARIVFEFAGLGQSSVRIIGPGNAVTYSHEINPTELNELVALWEFEGDLRDSSGNGNDADSFQYDAHIASDPQRGQVLSVDGGTDGDYDYVRRDSLNNAPLDDSPRTMAAWVKPVGYPTTNYNGVVAYSMGCNAGSTPGKGSLLSVQNHPTNGNRVSMAFWCNDAYQATGNEITANQWNHVAFTYDGGTSVRFYINGNFEEERTLTAGAPAATENGPVRIGCTDDPGTRCFRGFIDDVTIWDRALTENEIKALAS